MASRAWSCKSSSTPSAMLHAYVRPHGLCACLSAWPGSPQRPPSNCCHWRTSFSKMAARNGTPALSEIGGLPHHWKQEASKTGFIWGFVSVATHMIHKLTSTVWLQSDGANCKTHNSRRLLLTTLIPALSNTEKASCHGTSFFARQGFPPQLSRDKVGNTLGFTRCSADIAFTNLARLTSLPPLLGWPLLAQHWGLSKWMNFHTGETQAAYFCKHFDLSAATRAAGPVLDTLPQLKISGMYVPSQ